MILESSHCIINDSQNDKIIFMAIEMKMFIQLIIFQNMKVIIDVFLTCMMRVGCGIGDWDM